MACGSDQEYHSFFLVMAIVKPGHHHSRSQKANTKVTPQVKGSNIRMRVNVKASGTIVEYRCADDLSQPASITKVERDISEELKRVIMKSCKSLQKNHADIVGFGTIMRERIPNIGRK